MSSLDDKQQNIQKAREECVFLLSEKMVENEDKMMRIVREVCAKYGVGCIDLKKSSLIETYNKLLLEKRVERDWLLEKVLRKRKIRTESGVSVISVMTKPLSCPGNCVYCPTQQNMPKSYLDNQPAAMRGVMFDFDPYDQVASRLDMLRKMGHDVSKNEVIILGGTFGAHPRKYQEWFVRRIFDAFNIFESKLQVETQIETQNIASLHGNVASDLQEAKKINETAVCRCIGLTIETRPDYVNYEEMAWLRYLGATRVELGVQSVFDDVLKLVRRGHDIEKTKEATKILRQAGFKIVYHMMPGLPGSSADRDIEMFGLLFSDEGFFPDHLKVYPTVVLEDSELYKWWKDGKYRPYQKNELISVLLEIKKNIPEWVRIVRLMRDIPQDSVIDGIKDSNLRQLLEKEGVVCKCIRCREPKSQIIGDVELVKREYLVRGGKEIFLSYENSEKSKILALLRLFIPDEIESELLKHLPELEGCAMVRELHTYGKVVGVGKDMEKESQHRGLGKKLMIEAEKIALSGGYKKMAVIAGVGVRQYYENIGYNLEGEYMIKDLV